VAILLDLHWVSFMTSPEMAVYFKHRESVTINMANYKKVYVVIGICYYFRKK